MHPLRTLRTLSLAALPAIATLAGAGMSPMAHATAPICTLHRVYSVTSINLVMRGPRVMLTVTGMANAAGWHGAVLRPAPRTGAAGTAHYDLLACAPGFSARGDPRAAPATRSAARDRGASADQPRPHRRRDIPAATSSGLGLMAVGAASAQVL